MNSSGISCSGPSTLSSFRGLRRPEVVHHVGRNDSNPIHTKESGAIRMGLAPRWRKDDPPTGRRNPAPCPLPAIKKQKIKEMTKGFVPPLYTARIFHAGAPLPTKKNEPAAENIGKTSANAGLPPLGGLRQEENHIWPWPPEIARPTPFFPEGYFHEG